MPRSDQRTTVLYNPIPELKLLLEEMSVVDRLLSNANILYRPSTWENNKTKIQTTINHYHDKTKYVSESDVRSFRHISMFHQIVSTLSNLNSLESSSLKEDYEQYIRLSSSNQGYIISLKYEFLNAVSQSKSFPIEAIRNLLDFAARTPSHELPNITSVVKRLLPHFSEMITLELLNALTRANDFADLQSDIVNAMNTLYEGCQKNTNPYNSIIEKSLDSPFPNEISKQILFFTSPESSKELLKRFIKISSNMIISNNHEQLLLLWALIRRFPKVSIDNQLKIIDNFDGHQETMLAILEQHNKGEQLGVLDLMSLLDNQETREPLIAILAREDIGGYTPPVSSQPKGP